MAKHLTGAIITLLIGAALIVSTANSNRSDGAAPMITFIAGAVLAILGLVWAVTAVARGSKGPQR